MKENVSGCFFSEHSVDISLWQYFDECIFYSGGVAYR